MFSSSYKIDPYKYTVSKVEIAGVKIANFMSAQRKKTGDSEGDIALLATATKRFAKIHSLLTD